jgi:excisionase family DNA binding protein
MFVFDKTENMLTVTEVAELIHVHPNTLRRWSDQGRIASFRLPPRGDRRFRPCDLTTFLTEFNAPNQDSEAN